MSTSTSSSRATATMTMVAAAVLLVFGACCTNVLLMEYLIQNDSGAGNLVTFLEYLFIAAEGFLFTARCGRRPLGIPFRAYYPVVGLHFAAGVCSNYALQLRIPMPLYMVFSSATLCVNMAMGVWLLGRRYGALKYAAVAMITVGVGVFTAASAQQNSRHRRHGTGWSDDLPEKMGVDRPYLTETQ